MDVWTLIWFHHHLDRTCKDVFLRNIFQKCEFLVSKEKSWVLNKGKEKFYTLTGKELKRFWFGDHNMGSIIISSIISFLKADTHGEVPDKCFHWWFLMRYDTNWNPRTDRETGNRVKKFQTEDEWYLDQPRGFKEVNNAHLESQIFDLMKAIILLTK